MKLDIAVLAGDGIGPEVTAEAVKVLKAIEKKFNHQFRFKSALVGATAIFKTYDPLPEETLSLCKKADAILFGAIGHPEFDNNPNSKIRPEQGLLKLRKELNLFLNERPVKAYEQLFDKSPLKSHIIKNVDLVIFRELIGGLYFGEKKLSKDGKTASDNCIYNKFEIERVAHLAFKAAKKRKQKVTLVDKANVLETSRLWRKVVTEISKSYPEITYETLFVDNAAMQLVLNPRQFDVILTENLFGDILSDQASTIGGSIGILPSASVGEKYAMFEPIHGSYYQATGKGIANPLASILSAAMLLRHFNLIDEANLVEFAVEKSISAEIATADLVENSPYAATLVGDFIEGTIENTDIIIEIEKQFVV